MSWASSGKRIRLPHRATRLEVLGGVAVHEAGHLLVGRLLGWGVQHAAIVPTEDTLGHVQFSFAADGPLAILVHRAGDVAANRYLDARRAIPPRTARIGAPPRESTPSDLRKVTDDLDVAASLEQWFEAIKTADERVAAVLDDHWASVEALAVALLERRTITGAEIEAICAVSHEPGALDRWLDENDDGAPAPAIINLETDS